MHYVCLTAAVPQGSDWTCGPHEALVALSNWRQKRVHRSFISMLFYRASLSIDVIY